jgi:hypothetical protein
MKINIVCLVTLLVFVTLASVVLTLADGGTPAPPLCAPRTNC